MGVVQNNKSNPFLAGPKWFFVYKTKNPLFRVQTPPNHPAGLTDPTSSR
jgi:hypothetical protein